MATGESQCTWCRKKWAHNVKLPPAGECLFCHSLRWQPDFDPNKTIGFGNEYAIRQFSTVDGAVHVSLPFAASTGGGGWANLRLEKFLLEQLREQARNLSLRLDDLTNERYSIVFVRDNQGAVRIRELRPNPYKKS
jgi:hypothetical protein